MKKKPLWLLLSVIGGILLACTLLCVLVAVYPDSEQQIQESLPQLSSLSTLTNTPSSTFTPTPTKEPTATPTEEPTATSNPPTPKPKPRGLLNLQHPYAKAVLTKNGFACDDLTIIKFKYGRYCRLDRLMEEGFVYIVELYGEDEQIVDYISASITTDEPQKVIDFFNLVAGMPYKGTLPERVGKWIEKEVRNPDEDANPIFNGMSFQIFSSSMVISEP